VRLNPAIQKRPGGSQTWSGAMAVYKRATHDGNYTVYREREVVGCGLTRAAADALIAALTAHGAAPRLG
jgi:hypothetical protein